MDDDTIPASTEHIAAVTPDLDEHGVESAAAAAAGLAHMDFDYDSDMEDVAAADGDIACQINMAPVAGRPVPERLEWWFSQLRVEQADLVGQLGGSCGISLVNLETLIVRIALDSAYNTGLTDEPQFLRVIFFVERFLQLFTDCGARVRLIFFHCLRPFLSLFGPELPAVREAILLLCSARQSWVDFAVFDSWSDPQFLAARTEWQPPYLLMDDCMEFEPTIDASEDVKEESIAERRVLPLVLLQRCATLQLHIALLSDLERRGRKINAFTVSPHGAAISTLHTAAMALSTTVYGRHAQQFVPSSVAPEVWWENYALEVKKKTGHWPRYVNIRDVLFAWTVSTSAVGEDAGVVLALGQAALVASAVAQTLPLDARCFANLFEKDNSEEETELFRTAAAFVSFLAEECTLPLARFASVIQQHRGEGTMPESVKHLLETTLAEGCADFLDSRLFSAVVTLAAAECLERGHYSVDADFFGLGEGQVCELEILVSCYESLLSEPGKTLFPLDLSVLKDLIHESEDVLRSRSASPSEVANPVGRPSEVWPVESVFMSQLLRTSDPKADLPEVTVVKDAPQNDAEIYTFRTPALAEWTPSYMLDVANLFLAKVTHQKNNREALVDERRLERFSGAARERARRRAHLRALQKGAFREHKFAISVAGNSQYHHAIVTSRKGTHIWDTSGAFALEKGLLASQSASTLPALEKPAVTSPTQAAAQGVNKKAGGVAPSKKIVEKPEKKKMSKAEEIIKKNQEAQKLKALKLDQDRLAPVVEQIHKIGHRATTPAALLSKLLDVTEGCQRVNEDIATFKALDTLLKLPESRMKALLAAVQMIHTSLGRNFQLSKLPASQQHQLHKLICYFFHFVHSIYRRYASLLSTQDIQLLQTALIGIGFVNSAHALYGDWCPRALAIAMEVTPLASSGKKAGGKKSGTDKAEMKKIKATIDGARVLPSSVPEQSYRVPINCEVEAQLQYMGHQMERSLGSKSDPRVKFNPDAWQRRLLDVIDDHRSALVCAPTGSGKTFLCYYAMEKVLSYDDDSVVVFTCPSKALVAQVGLEVAARFRAKEYPPFCNTVLDGLMLRERATSALNCQILLTLPDLFEMLLMSAHHRDWVRKIKYVIMDEIHCIGESDEIGRAWERVVELMPCPFLALSATVGNPDSFLHWLSRAHCSSEYKRVDGKPAVEVIHFSERFADLAACVYSPDLTIDVDEYRASGDVLPELNALMTESAATQHPSVATAEGSTVATLSKRVLKLQGGLFPLNAFASLRYHQVRNLGLTADFYAPSGDMLRVYSVLSNVLNQAYDTEAKRQALTPEQKSCLDYYFTQLSPAFYFGSTPAITKRQYRYYLASFKQHMEQLVQLDVLNQDMFDHMLLALQCVRASPIVTQRGFLWQPLLQEEPLSKALQAVSNEITGALDTGANLAVILGRPKTTDGYHVTQNLVNFCRVLRRNGLLPALMFNFSRSEVVTLGTILLKALQAGQHDKYYGTPEAAEQTKRLNKEVQDKHKQLVKHYEMLEKMKSLSKEQKEAQGLTTESIEAELSQPLPPPPGDIAEGYDADFNFSDRRVWGKDHDEIEQLIGDAERCFHSKKEGTQWAEALRRGFGVHHSGMPRRYRVAVEALFRKAFLTIVFSTETLSIGINMPCKSTVFIGDSLMLTPLLYRQTSGRAGRRGYDSFGHVIYWELPFPKIRRLACAPLPVVSGEFPVTPTLALRTFQLLHTAETLRLEALVSTAKKSVTEQRHEAEQLQQNMTALVRSLLRLYRCPLFSVASADVRTEPVTELKNDMAMKYAFRFAVDFLRKQELIDHETACIGLAGIVSRLYELEPRNLAINALLLQGALHATLEDASKPRPEELLPVDGHIESHDPAVHDSGFPAWRLRRILVVWCYCVASLKLHYNAVCHAKLVPSFNPFLPPITGDIAEGLKKLRGEAMQNGVNYVASLYSAIRTRAPELIPFELRLPLSHVNFDRTESEAKNESKFAKMLESVSVKPRAQSPFAAISGKRDDELISPQELSFGCPTCVHFEPSLVPAVFWKTVTVNGREIPLLSNYAVNFFSYGSLAQAVKDSGADANSIWFQLSALIKVLEAAADFVRAITPADRLSTALRTLQRRMDALQRGEAA